MFIKAKVCLVGEASVGKTSLARRFVLDQFDDRYLPTMGAKVTKKEVLLEPEGTQVVLTIWDIMGEPEFRELLKDGYFRGCNAVLAVADGARSATVQALAEWVFAVRRVSGPVPVIVLLNKGDLPPDPESAYALRDHLRVLPGPSWRTSAKTGENVEAAFLDVARSVARVAVQGRESVLPRRGAPPGARAPPTPSAETAESEARDEGRDARNE